LRRTTIMATVTVGLLALAFGASFQGCSPSQDIGGTRVQNALPDTRVTGTPPVLGQTDFSVHFFWTGFDPDGEVKGFQWKISSNGVDGISVYDTLTVDPATGDTLNPWHFTSATDTTFIVTADSSGFAQDAGLPEQDQRFFQPHTLLVRSIDDRGAVDPTPALLTFTATTLAPTVRLTSPPALAGNYRSAQMLPPTFTLRWIGTDPDFEQGTPTQVRYLLKVARLGDRYIQTQYDYNRHLEELISFHEPGWSDWVPYGLNDEERKVTFTKPSRDANGNFIYYLFAIQARDTAGAVSLDRGYARTVHNFRIDSTLRPLLVVRESFLGTYSGVGLVTPATIDIAKNQPLSFQWMGEASSYGSEIAGYRYGWDVVDPEDDADPGWQVQFGLSAAHMHAPIKTFSSGTHTLLVQCIDQSGVQSMTQAIIVLSVVPVPDVADQRPVLLVDGIKDQTSRQWPDQSGTTYYGNDVERDAFWLSALARSGGVAGFSEAVDMVDLESNVADISYRRAVNYRTLIWTIDFNRNSPVISDFKIGRVSIAGHSIMSLPFNWLATYQTDVGNLFLAGADAVSSFQPSSPQNAAIDWMFPIIFDSTDDFKNCENLGQMRAIGYGIDRDIDGNLIVVGRESYPFASLGLAMLSKVNPTNLYIQGSNCLAISDLRHDKCVGPKALVLDQQFKERHVSFGAVADTVFMWPNVDWAETGDVQDNWNFGKLVELYDFNGSERSDPWTPQQLPDGSPAIEPMWRIYTRYDWLLDQHLRDGDTSYPDFDPAEVCGSKAINSMTGRTRIDGAPVGFFSYKSAATKPGGKADVVWGFEPSIYDHEKMVQAIQWVLGTYLGLPMAP